MVFDFLSPLDSELVQSLQALSGQHLAGKVTFHTHDDFPDLDKVKIAIVGVPEYRGLSASHNVPETVNPVRREFYSLYPGNWEASVADLGDIVPGNSAGDTAFALREVVSALLTKRIIPIIIGGSQDLTYAMYRGYDRQEQMVNLVSIDSRFDFGREEDDISAGSYMSRIIVDEPNNLFNFCNLGYQTYYNSQEEIDLVEKLFFDAYRLGELSANISLAEPVLRDADLVSIDLTSVMSSHSGNFGNFIPNGFNGREICALARYAGISDKVSAIGIFNQSGSEREAALIAQLIWYFVEGWQYRSNEYPFGSREHYLKYIVPVEDDDIVFFKSPKTDRWWIEIPFLPNVDTKLRKSTLLPCSYEEYLSATQGEVPERWWKAQKKNAIC
jgi:arginase family enzyme